MNLKAAFSAYDLDYASALLKQKAKKVIYPLIEENKTKADNQYKYLHLDEWIPKYVYMARSLLLHQKSGLRMLDIGSGPGWMSWLAKELGHSAQGIDLPDRQTIYSDMSKKLEAPVRPFKLEPFKSLDDGVKYDIIIALMASFYIYDFKWDGNAFKYLLTDIERQANENYIILFEMNHWAGRHYPLEVLDAFLNHGYRIFDQFALKINGYPANDEKFIYNCLSRWQRIGKDPWKGIWNYAQPSMAKLYSGIYLDSLLADFPRDSDLLAQKGLFYALTNEYEKAISSFENISDQFHVGRSVASAQIYLFKKNRSKALQSIARIIKSQPENDIGKEWLSLLELDTARPVYEASPCWNKIYYLLSKSEIFNKLLQSSELSSQKDPVSWYLRYGATCSGYIPEFTPVLYWGMNNKVFRAGIDPLVHFIFNGK